MNLLSYQQLKQFVECNFLYSEHNYREKYFPQEVRLVAETAKSIFTKEMELGYQPSFDSPINAFSRGASIIKLARQKTVFWSLKLKDFYSKYLSEIYGAGYRCIFTDMPVQHGYGQTLYQARIPAVLASRDKTVIPVFYSDGKINIRQDNFIQFACAILQQASGMPIEKALIIHCNKKSLDLYFCKVRLQTNTIQLLEGTMHMIDQGLSMSNYNNCEQCKFSKDCRSCGLRIIGTEI